MIFIIIILLLIIAFWAFDFYDSLATWLGRIKIGIYDKGEFAEKTQQIIYKWYLKKVPEVPADTKARLKLVGKIKSIGKVSSIAYWQNAAVLKAFDAIDEAEIDDTLISDFINIDSGEWKIKPTRIDSAMLAYEIMSCSGIDNSDIRPATDFIADMLGDKISRYGAIPYNDSLPNVRFVDTVGMTAPFMIKYGLTCGKDEFIESAINMIREYKKYGFNSDLKLPYHCYNDTDKSPLGVCAWGRGCAWWALGVVESLKILLDSDNYTKEKAILLKYSLEILEQTAKKQNSNGSYNRFMLVDSAEDSSTAAMLAYCNAVMYNITKKDEFKQSAELALKHIATRTRKNGVIDFSQGDTMGIGYYSDSLSVVPAAQGFAVTALTIL